LRLTELIADDNAGPMAGIHCDTEVAGLTADSRDVRQGFLFAAIQGTQTDGRSYIGEAISAGAVAILTQSGVTTENIDTEIPVITDANPRQRLARMAARFYDLQPTKIAAVTGTNGKTSVVHFAQQLWTGLGCKAAGLGTLGVIGPNLESPDGGSAFKLTTPDPVVLHKTLSELQNLGVDYVACEASSHGLSQYRLDGLKITAGAFTNLSRDHLDYHTSMETYRDAKLRLFEELVPDGGTIVVNIDSNVYGAIAEIANTRSLLRITYGFEASDLHCLDATPIEDGWRIKLDAFGTVYEIAFPLHGRFQIANALCAAGLVIACGVDPSAVIPLLADLNCVPGRMELAARLDKGARIFIDYAHTPEALRTALNSLRTHVSDRITIVFGCGGDRDKGKRPEMGRIASALTDSVIVTDDNPRSEDAISIRQDILRACPAARDIGDRATAIRAGIETLRPSDVLLVAGKGHESGQIVGQKTLPFNDIDIVRDTVRVREQQSS
jgi:UDP-N-acetylmuramoyl-L-alanyl-D-glutamate--2,6-diaminopimelate ligase